MKNTRSAKREAAGTLFPHGGNAPISRQGNPAVGSSRGQLAFEFMLIYSFFITVFVAALFVVSQRSAEQQLYAEGVFAKEVAMRFSDEIKIASSILGYEKNYSFPRTMRSVPYGVRVSNGLLELNYSTGREIDIVYPIATSDVVLNGIDTSASSSSFDTAKGWAVIRNVNGRVVITQ
ncbi:Uncharacterised protein [uncultured archaeon]|nr:Uncharacterised protein [uncultured archaeon]